MAIEGKITPERGFAAFMTGVLDGYVKGRGLQMAGAQEQRAAELQAVEMKAAELQQRKLNAELREFEATESLRRQKARAEIGALNRQGSAEILEAKALKAQADAERAQALLEKAQAELEETRLMNNLGDLMNALQQQMGTGPGATGGFTGGADVGAEDFEGSLDAPEGVDTRDMPALEPGETPQGMLSPGTTKGIVPGGRRVLTGPPREGDIMEEAATDPRTGGKQLPFLPPGVPPVARKIPILPSEIKKAMESENADAAIQALVSNEGQQFGAALAKQKKTDPVAYNKTMQAEIEKHKKLYPSLYNAYRIPGGGMESEVAVRMQRILTDPRVRAWQSPNDTDVAASQVVAELSLETLLAQNNKNKIRTYISMDAANNGDIARYNGRLLNQAMDDVFGGRAQYLRFSDDVEYSLRQIIDALYSDEMSATGDAALGFTNPLTPTDVSGFKHPIMELLNTYWEPVRALDRRTVNYPGQYKNPLLSRPGRE